MPKFDKRAFLAEKSARRSLNTLLNFTAAKAAENRAMGIQTQTPPYADTVALYAALNAQSPENIPAILDDLTNYCLDTIQQSNRIPKDLKTRLLDQMSSNPALRVKKMHIAFWILLSLGIGAAMLAWMVMVANDPKDENSSARIFGLLILTAVLETITITSSVCICETAYAEITASDDNFVAWSNAVAKLIDREIGLLEPIATAEVIDDLENSSNTGRRVADLQLVEVQGIALQSTSGGSVREYRPVAKI